MKSEICAAGQQKISCTLLEGEERRKIGRDGEVVSQEKQVISHAEEKFEVGELYLFHPTDPTCPAEESLWGCYESGEDEGEILLESTTLDFHLFNLRRKLPQNYSHHRLATRAELRDYMYALGLFEKR
uniref:hypothetical protein n=1 Tax=Alistipes sp. TaxID=1872444 RepID=UPI004056618F